MIENEFIIGLERGVGQARFIFNKITKTKPKKKSKLPKINFADDEFTKQQIEKCFSIGIYPENGEVLFWSILKCIQLTEEASICIPKILLIDFLKRKCPDINVENELNTITQKKDSILVEVFDSYYFNKNRNLEFNLAELIKNRINLKTEFKFDLIEIDNLSTEQKLAVESVLKNSMSIISGGPGTGKTKIIQSIVELAIHNNIPVEKISLIAPTGKAAKRLRESCNDIYQKYKNLTEPKTIHRFLGFSPNSGKFRFNKEKPHNSSLVIIDESSMIDIELMNAVFLANDSTEKQNQIVLVGDPNQLLSVSSGSIFSDLCRMNLNHYQLTKSFRQTKNEGKAIVDFAEALRNNLPIEKIIPLINISEINSNQKSGINFYETKSDEESIQLVSNWYKEFKSISKNIQILSPHKDTSIGTHKLNAKIISELDLNENYPSMLTQNMYNFELFNGEIGIIENKKDSFDFILNGKVFPIPNSFRINFEPAIAITVHKSQGSEYEHISVIIPINFRVEDKFISKRILYTAITRAQKSVTIVGSIESLKSIIENLGEPRYSNLEKRILSSS